MPGSHYRKKTIVIVSLLLLQGMFISFNIFLTWSKSLNINVAATMSGIASLIILVVLISEIIRLTEKEQDAELNALRLQESEQMVHVLRTHRHDFLNHIQVIYGLAKIGRIDSLAKYVDELACGMEAESKLTLLSQPEVAALLIKKANTASVRGISFKVDVSTDLRKVVVPPVDLIRLIGNLIDNAFYAVEKYDLTEKLVRVNITEQPNWYVLSVCNNGPEIPREIRDRIFEKGFSTKGSEGSGLGLYICRELVEKYGGKITLTSIMDFNTCFLITLPSNDA